MDTNQKLMNYKQVQDDILGNEHEFVILPNGKEIGIVNAEIATNNLSNIISLAKRAFEQGFFIEFISLKIQFIEFYLKIFWVIKNPEGKTLDEAKKMFFGTLISDCHNFGLEQQLFEKIDEFNFERVECIHKYLMGGTTEEQMKNLCEKHRKLGNEVSQFVINACFTYMDDVTKIPQDVHTMIQTRRKK